MINRKKRWAFVISTVCVLALFGVWMSSLFFYNPYAQKNSGRIYETFTYTGELLYPDLLDVYLDSNIKRYALLGYEQVIKLEKGVEYLSENSVHYGKLRYGKDTAQLSIYDPDKLMSNVKPQAFYLKGVACEKDVPLENGIYYYTLRTEQPLELFDLFAMMKPVIKQEEKTHPVKVAWIPIQTSFSGDDITVGLRGEVKRDSTAAEHYVKDHFTAELVYFERSLEHLASQALETKIVSSTGLSCGLTQQDYQNRLQYIGENGVKAMGAVVVADETFLTDLILEQFEVLQIERYK